MTNTAGVASAATSRGGTSGLIPSDAWAIHLQKARVGLLSGLFAGLIAGVASRVAMRVVAVEGGAEPAFTVEGTLFIVVAGVVVGAPLGVLFVGVRRWLPGPAAVQGFLYGLLLSLGFVSLLIPLFVGDVPEILNDLPGGNLPLAINVFVTPLVILGLMVDSLVKSLCRSN